MSARPACDTAGVTEIDTPEPPADDPDVEAFDAVCRRLAGFDSRIDTEWADGYLTAIAAGPRAVPTDEWLPKLCGDAFERTFADPQDQAQAMAALCTRLDRLLRALDPELLLDDDEHVHLAPLMQEWNDEARKELVDAGHASADEAAQMQTGLLWAEGFFDAVHEFAGDWPEPAADDELAEVYAAMLDTVIALMLDPASDEFKAFAKKGWKDADPTRDELIDEACFAIQDLRLYWLDHAPRPPPRRVEATPGRNDPCPCGSGKKFKKCHGAG
jgi:uncharacterized protein